MGRVGLRGHDVFGQKLLNIQNSVGRCTHKSPIMKWANTSKVFKKLHCSLYNNASWYTDTDGFLEHSPSGEACNTRDRSPPELSFLLFGGCLLSIHMHIFYIEKNTRRMYTKTFAVVISE